MTISLPVVKQIKGVSEELFSQTGIAVEVAVRVTDELLFIDVTTQDPQETKLIGERGDTLFSLQLILSLIINKVVGTDTQIILDVNNYRDRREKALEQLAKRVMEQVEKTGKEYVLEPMRPFERRIVHVIFQAAADKFETYSVGEEPNRQVVVKLK